MSKAKKTQKIIVVIFLLLSISNCVSRVAIKSDYDFSKIKRVGVLSFTDYRRQQGSGETVADEFIRQLIRKNIDVVERIHLENILKEQDLNASGYINPQTAKKAGELLGVDVVITGTVTKYFAEDNYIFLLGTETLKFSNAIIESNEELKTQLFVTNAQVGISVRMIDVETGSVVWANSYSYDAFDIQTAIEWTVSDLLNSLKKVWPQMRK